MTSDRVGFQAKMKEALLIERLKKYEVPRAQGPVVEPHPLTGEERFYMKKMAQKRSNYVPIGVRGVFGGVILNMHLHWKKHETVKVICKPCKPGQVHEYADEISRLSGGIPIQIIGDDTIVFYRGKNYVHPKVMSPVDTLSKKRVSSLHFVKLNIVDINCGYVQEYMVFLCMIFLLYHVLLDLYESIHVFEHSILPPILLHTKITNEGTFILSKNFWILINWSFYLPQQIETESLLPSFDLLT